MTASNPRILMMAADGFAELVETASALREAGFAVVLATPGGLPVEGVAFDEPVTMSGATTHRVEADVAITDVDADGFDALVLPGGVRNPDTLRMNADAVALVRAFDARSALIGAICHAPWLLVEADVVRGRRVACWRSIRTDLVNAGATVEDRPVVVDGHLVTSRMPGDIAAFARVIGETLGAARALPGNARASPCAGTRSPR